VEWRLGCVVQEKLVLESSSNRANLKVAVVIEEQ